MGYWAEHMAFKIKEDNLMKPDWEPIFRKEAESVRKAAEQMRVFGDAARRALYPEDILSLYPGDEVANQRPASLNQVIEQKKDKKKFYDNVVGNDWKSKNKRNYLKGKQ